jgi:hypothetical protein
MKKYLVEYELPYVHTVQVGIEAESDADAIAQAREAFLQASIWDNTPDMPLLYDQYEEAAPIKHELEFKVVDEVDAWPEPDFSVTSYIETQVAKVACRLLIAAFGSEGSVRDGLLREAMEQACLALPRLDQDDIAETIQRSQQRIPTAVVLVDGGVVQWLVSDLPAMQYLVLDSDTDGNSAMRVTMENGDELDVLPVSVSGADSLPDWVASLLKEIDEG